MEPSLLNIGFGSTVVAHRIVSIVSPNSAPMKRLKDEAKDEKRLIDATHGRRTRSILSWTATMLFYQQYRLRRYPSGIQCLRKLSKSNEQHKRQTIWFKTRISD